MAKHIVAVTALIKNPVGDKFLVLQRGAHEVAFPDRWAFPGGKAEDQDANLAEVLRREVREETGLEIEGGKTYLKDYAFTRPDGQHVIGICFGVQATSDAVRLAGDFQAFRWITPGELSGLDHIAGMEEEVSAAFDTHGIR